MAALFLRQRGEVAVEAVLGEVERAADEPLREGRRSTRGPCPSVLRQCERLRPARPRSLRGPRRCADRALRTPSRLLTWALALKAAGRREDPALLQDGLDVVSSSSSDAMRARHAAAQRQNDTAVPERLAGRVLRSAREMLFSPASSASASLDRYIIREILPPTGLGLLVFTFVLLLDADREPADSVLVSRGADLPTIVPALPEPAAQHLRRHHPHGLPAGRAAGLRPPGQRERDRGHARERHQPARSCCVPVLVLSALDRPASPSTSWPSRCPQANQAYRETFFALVVSKARSRLKPRVFTDDLVPEHGALRLGHPRGDRRVEGRVHLRHAAAGQTPKVILARTRPPRHRQGQRSRSSCTSSRACSHTSTRTQPEGYDQRRFRDELPAALRPVLPEGPAGQGRPRDDAARAAAQDRAS